MKKVQVLLASALLLTTGTVFANKPTIGVAEFTNTATGVHWWSGGVGQELASLVSNELSSTGSFRVVERAKVDSVITEQDLAASGRINAATGAKFGQMTGAQYLVLGTVTSFESNVKSTGGGLSFGGVSIGGKKEDAYLAIDLRVVDTTTGEIAHARTVEGRTSGMGLNLGVFRSGFGGRLNNESKTPAGKAIRAAIVEITDYLECVMISGGSCVGEFQAKEEKRRSGLKNVLKLD
jgi:curli biogenesis system outer membrane secretion channel CsgG